MKCSQALYRHAALLLEGPLPPAHRLSSLKSIQLSTYNHPRLVLLGQRWFRPLPVQRHNRGSSSALDGFRTIPVAVTFVTRAAKSTLCRTGGCDVALSYDANSSSTFAYVKQSLLTLATPATKPRLANYTTDDVSLG